MNELIGCWLIVDMAAIAWLLFECHTADLGPMYDENFRPIP